MTTLRHISAATLRPTPDDYQKNSFYSLDDETCE
jgi:hypothetical protein